MLAVRHKRCYDKYAINKFYGIIAFLKLPLLFAGAVSFKGIVYFIRINNYEDICQFFLSIYIFLPIYYNEDKARIAQFCMEADIRHQTCYCSCGNRFIFVCVQ